MLALWIGHADSTIVAFAEGGGAFSQVAACARRLPADRPILVRGSNDWMTPLALAFDRDIVPAERSGMFAPEAEVSLDALARAVVGPRFLLVDEEIDAPGMEVLATCPVGAATPRGDARPAAVEGLDARDDAHPARSLAPGGDRGARRKCARCEACARSSRAGIRRPGAGRRRAVSLDEWERASPFRSRASTLRQRSLSISWWRGPPVRRSRFASTAAQSSPSVCRPAALQRSSISKARDSPARS